MRLRGHRQGYEGTGSALPDSQLPWKKLKILFLYGLGLWNKNSPENSDILCKLGMVSQALFTNCGHLTISCWKSPGWKSPGWKSPGWKKHLCKWPSWFLSQICSLLHFVTWIFCQNNGLAQKSSLSIISTAFMQMYLDFCCGRAGEQAGIG